MSSEQNSAEQDGQHEQEKQQQSPLENEELEYDAFSDGIDPVARKNTQHSSSDPNEDQVRITILEEELTRTKDQMMRAVAEAENGRKRALKEREDASKYAVSSFSRDLLSVADNLRRALDAVPTELLEQNPQIKNLTDGVEATERELLRSFEKNGIKKTEPLNERFDPYFHEVMFEAPMPGKEEGTIIQVIEAGYTLHGRILRPARVGIAKNDASKKAPAASEPGQTLNTEV